MRVFNSFASLGVLWLAVSPAVADVVTTSDGSRIVGTVEQVAGGKLTIQTEIAGRLEIDMTKVTAIATDASVNVAVQSGDTAVGAMDIADSGKGSIVHSKLGELSVDASTIAQLWPEGKESPEIVAIRTEAQKTIEAAQPKWTATLEGGVTRREGNTDTLEGHGALQVDRKTSRDLLQLYLRGKYYEDTGKRTENEYLGGIRYEGNLTDRSYWYARTEMEFDEFENLDLRSTAAAGFGYYWLKRDDHELKTSIGVGYRHESYDTGRSKDSSVLDLGLNYRLDISDWLRFTQSLVYSPDFLEFDDYRLDSDTAVLIPFKDDSLAWKTGMRYQYNSRPVGNNERLDKMYYTSLVLKIK